MQNRCIENWLQKREILSFFSFDITRRNRDMKKKKKIEAAFDYSNNIVVSASVSASKTLYLRQSSKIQPYIFDREKQFLPWTSPCSATTSAELPYRKTSSLLPPPLSLSTSLRPIFKVAMWIGSRGRAGLTLWKRTELDPPYPLCTSLHTLLGRRCRSWGCIKGAITSIVRHCFLTN